MCEGERQVGFGSACRGEDVCASGGMTWCKKGDKVGEITNKWGGLPTCMGSCKWMRGREVE